MDGSGDFGLGLVIGESRFFVICNLFFLRWPRDGVGPYVKCYFYVLGFVVSVVNVFLKVFC